MHPEATSYRLMEPEDKPRLRYLAKKWDQPLQKLGFPTVVAWRNGKIIGFISTLPRKDAIIAGPLVVDIVNAGMVVLRLMEAYEHVLSMANVHVYNIYVTNDHWSDTISRALGTQALPHEGGYWHRRELDGRQRTAGSGTVSR